MLGQRLHNIVVTADAFGGRGVKNMVYISAEIVKQPPKKRSVLHAASHLNKNKKFSK